MNIRLTVHEWKIHLKNKLLFYQITTSGLKITAGQWTMSGPIEGLTGQTLVLPVILTGHFWMQTFYNIFHIVVT